MESNSTLADFSFPEGIISPAKCLVMLTGLDTKNNAVHMAIWDLFKAARRGERKPVKYRNVSADHLYPRRKQPVVDDGAANLSVSPCGILKLNWIEKHVSEIPGVVVFFFDLDWTHPQWDDKVIECASKIKVIRSSLNGHNTEICVALIQSVKPNPGGSDSTVSEKASQLCTACELPSPNLFIMPYVDRPEGYVNRLEGTFYEMALRFYNFQAKKIRIIKDGNKFLTARRMFKLAFYTEMKQDHKEALKHYMSVYKYLTDVMVPSEGRIMEYKMITGFVNYKICKLLFGLDDPRNAISQQQKFLDMFKKEKGPRELLFQHYEWIANQYSAFADLFTESVQTGLKPSQAQHPGLYYYQAVLHQLERRKLKETLCRKAYDLLPQPSSNLFTDIPAIEYIGERSWRVGLSDNQPSSSKLKEKTIEMLQAHEYTVDTSRHVTVLLSNALHHFKELDQHSEHMINHLKVLLSEEYFVAKDYQKCVSLLQVTVVDYRRKKWWKILTHILFIMLKCAYDQGLVTTYVSVCLELISRFSISLFKDKARIQDNLILTLKGEVPSPELDFDDQQSRFESIRQLWMHDFEAIQNQNEDEESVNTIEMSDLASCVECKTWFTEHTYTSDSLLRLEVYFRSSAPQPLSFAGVSITFDHAECNKWCILNEPFVLEPGKHKRLVFEFPTTSETLQVLTVEAFLGYFRLVWREGVSKCVSVLRDWAWNKIKTRSSTLILERESQISLCANHRPPILLSEIYPISICVTNGEERDITNIVVLSVLLQDHSSNPSSKDGLPLVRLYSSHPTPTSFPNPPSSPQADSHFCFEKICPTLSPGEKFECTFYVKSFSVGAHKLSINCTYNVDCLIKEEFDLIKCKCEKQETISIETVTPLRVNHKVLSMQFQPQDCVFFDEPFIIQTSISSLAPSSILISDTEYRLREKVVMNTNSVKQIANMELLQNDACTELHSMAISSEGVSSNSIVGLGMYSMKWMRAKSVEGIEPTIVNVNLPQVSVKLIPYSVRIDVPAFAVHNELFTITYKIQNRTAYIQSFDCVFPLSSEFVFSGNRVNTFKVLPSSTITFSFNLIPLNVGYVLLPRLEVTCTTQPNLDEQVLRGVYTNIPTSIFIMPLPMGKNPGDIHNSATSSSSVAAASS